MKYALVAILLLILVFIWWLRDGPERVRDWIKDHCRWYRRGKGGRWGKWNGFWERASDGGSLSFKRGYLGVDISEGSAVYRYRAFMSMTDATVAEREDYTK